MAGKRTRRRYTDEDRATALAVLDSNGGGTIADALENLAERESGIRMLAGQQARERGGETFALMFHAGSRLS